VQDPRLSGSHQAYKRLEAATLLIADAFADDFALELLEHGMMYRNRRYKSLSEVARAITGARWSGPLFFGLKHRAKEAANG
jgi:Protein of unknown function (DUF2924)